MSDQPSGDVPPAKLSDVWTRLEAIGAWLERRFRLPDPPEADEPTIVEVPR